MQATTTTSIEIEITLQGVYRPGQPERGPTYASGGEPAEDPSVEDVEIVGLSGLQRDWGAKAGLIWIPVSLLDGVNVRSPDIIKLFDNILSFLGEDADEALINEVRE